MIRFNTVWIHGMGMMGASLALALRKSSEFKGRVLGAVRSEKSAEYIRTTDLCDDVCVVSSGKEARLHIESLDSNSLVVLGVPVASAVALLGDLGGLPHLVTDMSSTRADVQNAARNVRFVGSHPICGSEDTGPQAARPGLFENRLCIITPASHSKEEDVTLVQEFWQDLGMNVVSMPADEHDRILAYLSHGPHVISGLMAHWGMSPSVAKAVHRSPVPLTGGGFRDMVRIAGSNPEMWLDIFRTNRKEIVASLEAFREAMSETIRLLEKGTDEELMQWLRDARRKRNILSGYPEDK